jgi:hypothetical protein
MGRMFRVEIAVHGGMTYCVPLKQELDEWISGHEGDSSLLPAVKLESGQPREALRVRLVWIEMPGPSAWAAIMKAGEILADGCPRIVDAEIALDVTSEVHDPNPDRRRPRGA